jgi:kumamolisin
MEKKGIPNNYQPLEGSERHPSPNATLLSPADPKEVFQVTIALRRRPGGPPLPDFDYFAKTNPKDRPRLSADEFAAKYGADQADINKVVGFAQTHGLTVVETNAGRRTVIVSGTLAQMEEAFAVNLGLYEQESVVRRGDKPVKETYRGRDGFIHVPSDLTKVIVGVFGLDNRRITKRNAGDPPHTTYITVPEVTRLYNFPQNSAAGQTIAIFSETGYRPADIAHYYTTLPAGFVAPAIIDVSVDSGNGGWPDPETTQDICIASTAAPGAAIAVYFTTYSQVGWFDLIQRVAHPSPGDPICKVLSSSFYVSNGDDAATLAHEGISIGWLHAVNAAFHDAAIQGVTVCIASGDTGTYSKVGDGKAHVQYPASDPWVLGVGGTTVGDVVGASFDEYAWNDNTGATGGGISDFFALPPYQAGVGVPVSLNDGHVGRGVPDVAANASPNSGYPMIVGGMPFIGNGTSASAPLWAGLIAVINAAIGTEVGFVNPAFYALGSPAFRDILGAPGPANNGLGGVPGYPVVPGWDACTGWGSPNGRRLLAALAHEPVVATAFVAGGNFGNVCQGSFSDALLTINNAALPAIGTAASLASLGLLSISRITSNSPDFIVPDVSAYPLVVGAATSIEIGIRFQPTGFGPKTATISVISNDPAGPHDIPVFGNAPSGKLAVTGSTFFGGVKACCGKEREISICNVGECRLEVSSVAFKRKSHHWKLINNPFPATVYPGSSLTVVILYKATEKCPRSCELVITSNDPITPIRTLEMLAYTIWDDCGCEDCQKEKSHRRHNSQNCSGKCPDDCFDELDEVTDAVD